VNKLSQQSALWITVLYLLIVQPKAHASPDYGFWLGMDHSVPEDSSLVNLLKGFKQLIPNMNISLNVGKNTDLEAALQNLQNLKIKAGIQTIGDGYQQDQEIIWEQPDYTAIGCPDLSPKKASCCEPAVLCNTIHMAAMPGSAYRHIWKDWMTYASRSSAIAVTYPDSVWPFATVGSPGRAGYSPVTVAAFRLDLTEKDSGIRVVGEKNGTRVIHFSKYAESYIGAKPQPEWIGLRNWQDYAPPLPQQQNLSAINQNQSPEKWQHVPALTLFDLLVSYEWLKFQQDLAEFGNTLRKPVKYHLITNPESLGNGTDWKWLSRLSTPIFAANEFFGDSFNADGAYYNAAFFNRSASPTFALGVTFEGGNGGNSAPYLDIETTYALSYDISAALGITWMEADFLPKVFPEEMSRLCFRLKSNNNCEFYLRTLALQANGLGYAHFLQDAPKRRPIDLKVVTNRNLLRPFSIGWRPWEWLADGGYSTTIGSIRSLGYSYLGLAEDAEIGQELDNTHVILYEPLFPLQAGWAQIKTWLSNGQRSLITHAYVWRKSGLSRQAALVEASGFEPTLALSKETSQTCPVGSEIVGKNFQFSNKTSLRVYTLRNPQGWQVLTQCTTASGNLPIVSYRTVGKGRLYFFHIDPSESAVKKSKLIEAIYASLLPLVGAQADYQAQEAGIHRFYSQFYEIAAIRSFRINKFVPWQADGTTIPVAIRVSQPRRSYRVRYLLADQEATVSSDAQGWLRFTVHDHNYELVYFQPTGASGDAERSWQRLRQRSQQLKAFFSARTNPDVFAKLFPQR
jgi:hypothetical protein